MDAVSLKQYVARLSDNAEMPDAKHYPEVIVPGGEFHAFCAKIFSDENLRFDYMISLTAIDWNDHFMLVCHLNSTQFRHTLVVKHKISDRQNPVTDSLSDIWKTAEFHEREVYDLFGIRFRNHPDMRRLFLEEEYGFPLRKDFTDDSRIIVK